MLTFRFLLRRAGGLRNGAAIDCPGPPCIFSLHVQRSGSRLSGAMAAGTTLLSPQAHRNRVAEDGAAWGRREAHASAAERAEFRTDAGTKREDRRMAAFRWNRAPGDSAAAGRAFARPGTDEYRGRKELQ